METGALYGDYREDTGGVKTRLFSVLESMLDLHGRGQHNSDRYRSLYDQLKHIDPDNAQAWLDELNLPTPG